MAQFWENYVYMEFSMSYFFATLFPQVYKSLLSVNDSVVVLRWWLLSTELQLQEMYNHCNHRFVDISYRDLSLQTVVDGSSQREMETREKLLVNQLIWLVVREEIDHNRLLDCFFWLK